ncbi:MAG: hypothetical protein WC326_04095 [Candidatus Delongbacteria bacterium]
MCPDPTTPDRSNDPRPRPGGESGDRSGDRSRTRRRSSRGGRGRSGAPGATPAPAQGAPAGTPGGPPAGSAGGGGGRPPQGGGKPGGQGAPRNQQSGSGGGGGDNRNRSQGGRRPGEGGERPAGERPGGGRAPGQGGRGGQPAEGGRGQAPSQAQQQEAARARRRETEREIEAAPSLQDWSIEHLGYVAWMAHAQILPTATPQRAVRSYIVDIHAGEDAVNPRLWPAIAPFLKLEVVGPTAEAGARALGEAFRQLATELELAPAADYLRDNPPPEVTVSSPVQAALDTALPLDLDHPQEDIDIMNEGRKGAPLRRPE